LIDLTLAGTNYEVMKKALDILLDAPEYDLIVAVAGSSARFNPDLAVAPIIDSAGCAKPLAAMLVPDAPIALAQLTQAGIPCFYTPEACADAIAAVFARRVPGEPASVAEIGDTRALKEADAYRLLDELAVPHAAAATYAIDRPPVELPFDFPVVAKISSAEIPHKTEVGGVVLGIQNVLQLADAFGTLRANLKERAPGIECDEVLVQPMRRGLTEVLVGYRVDADAGPIIMLAAGGIWAEVMKDRAIRLAPVTVEVAREMIGEVKLLQTVSGLRGTKKGDLEALAQTISRLSQLAVRADLKISEAEVNPLMVMAEGEGVLAVDALILQG